MRVHEFEQIHRGYNLGYVEGLHGFKSVWRRTVDAHWREGHIYVDSTEDAYKLCVECVDFDIACQALEAKLGRKLTMEDLLKFKDELKTSASQRDPINHPPHYTATAVEPIDVIEAWGLGFCLGNVVKYIARSPHKGSQLEDLRKARWYLDREISKHEASERTRVAES